jgi:uncharacterized Zn-binding protein involved in type VI secretion
MRSIIRKGDRTSHGGIVMEGSPNSLLLGREIALVGHLVFCPKCGGNFPIVEDAAGRLHSFMDSETAVEGMSTACGALLIASQRIAVIGEAAHHEYNPAPPAPPSDICLACLEAAAKNASTMIVRG